MNVILDPVWPWGRLWDVLLAAGAVDRWLALAAALASAFVPMLILSRPAVTLRGQLARPAVVAPCVLILWGAVLVLRHGWAMAWVDTGNMAQALGWTVCLAAALLGPGLLAGVSLGSYLGSPRGSASRVPPRRILAVFLLRTLAFFLVFLAVTRPSLAFTERTETRSTLWIALDDSRSMSIVDEGERSRWQVSLAVLQKCAPLLAKLRDEAGVDARLFRFSTGVGDFDPASPGQPEGKRTDFGFMLRTLHERRDPALPPRALLLISDGADNGAAIPALGEAPRWRSASCPLHTFAVGKAETTRRQNDVAIVSISTSPQPFVPVKGKLTVRLSLDAHGYEGTRAKLRLFLESSDEKGAVTEKEAASRDIHLRLRTGNEETLIVEVPSRPGEVKVRAVIETPEPDALPLNNTIETFVTVSREGMSVLYVDRLRPEARAIDQALVTDPRIRVHLVAVRGKPAGKDVMGLDGQPYDAILIGGVTADELRLLDPKALEKIEAQVSRGAGLMMLGGIRAFGAGGWKGTPLEKVIPVDLAVDEQSDKPAQVLPTEDGARRLRYLFDLDGAADPRKAWDGLAKLQGFNALPLPNPARGTEAVLATANGRPVLVAGSYGGKGVSRVLAFGGDTTYRWKRNESSAARFTRFWRRAVTWLARQEEAEGGVWVRPDSRRIPVRSDLGFSAGLRNRAGSEVPGSSLEAQVVAPDGSVAKVSLSRGPMETRGQFAGTLKPGIYKIVVKGAGKEASGTSVKGESSSRVIVYDEDAEMTRPAAVPAFLGKLASAGGGEAYRIEQLPVFLRRLAERPISGAVAKRTLKPDWRTTGRSPFLAAFLTLFCTVACLEWGLRRWWGMA